MKRSGAFVLVLAILALAGLPACKNMSPDELRGTIEVTDYTSSWVSKVLPALAAPAHPRPSDQLPHQEHRDEAAELRQFQRRLPVQGRPGELRGCLPGLHPRQGHPARRHERSHRPEEQPRRRGQEPGRHPRQPGVEARLRPALRHLQGLDAGPPRRLRRLPRHRFQGTGTGRTEEVKWRTSFRPRSSSSAAAAGTRRSSSASKRRCARPASPPSTSSASRASSRRTPGSSPKAAGLKLLEPGQILFVVLSENATDEPGCLISASVGAAVPDDPSHYGYLAEHSDIGKSQREISLHTEYLAAEMLATKLGHRLREPGPDSKAGIVPHLERTVPQDAERDADGEGRKGDVDDGHRGRRADLLNKRRDQVFANFEGPGLRRRPRVGGDAKTGPSLRRPGPSFICPIPADRPSGS